MGIGIVIGRRIRWRSPETITFNYTPFVVRAELFRRYSASTVSAFLFTSPVIGLVLSHWDAPYST